MRVGIGGDEGVNGGDLRDLELRGRPLNVRIQERGRMVGVLLFAVEGMKDRTR
jgi:hypothetical protein